MDQIVFIDANIFLEIILKDKKNEECKKFLKRIIDGEILGITSDFIVFTCLLQIQHKTKDLNKMKDFIIFPQANLISSMNHLLAYTVRKKLSF